MLLEHVGLGEAAGAVHRAVVGSLADRDLSGRPGTQAVTDAVLTRLGA